MNKKIKKIIIFVIAFAVWVGLQTLFYYITNNSFLLQLEQSIKVIYSILSYIYSIITGIITYWYTIKLLRGNPWNPWD